VDESLNLAYHGTRAEKQGFNISLERDFDPTVGIAEDSGREHGASIRRGYQLSTGPRKIAAQEVEHVPAYSYSNRWVRVGGACSDAWIVAGEIRSGQGNRRYAAATTQAQRLNVLLRSFHPDVSVFPDRVVGSTCALSFSRIARRSLALRPAYSRCHQFVTR
jgi:hypothetical protein